MPLTLCGRAENVPYSLSRWTDVPAAKWSWFREQLRQGWMMAIDQRTSVPARWSLKPEDTLGLIIWTKDPRNLLADRELLRGYQVKVHVTVTGWVEVEKGAPSLLEGATLLCETAKAFGPENVTWRFTPVPILQDVTDRFRAIAAMAGNAGIKKCFVTFLQENDLMAEPRTLGEKASLLQKFAEDAHWYGLKLKLCYDDRAVLKAPLVPTYPRLHPNLELGVCSPPEDFTIPGVSNGPADTCGCSIVVDPFTINESCTLGCTYCYAANRESAPKKRNTTRGLPVVR